jgi:hypothetical protein
MHQHHCVNTYIKNFDSIIVSVRDDKNERTTCEYKYNIDAKTFTCIQKRRYFNNAPEKEWLDVLKELDDRFEQISKIYQLPYIKIIELSDAITYKKKKGYIWSVVKLEDIIPQTEKAAIEAAIVYEYDDF